MGDVTDDLNDKGGEVRQLLHECDMEPTYLARHGKDKRMPATHDRGKKCIDMIAMSIDVPPGTIR
jgi:hypothetical protein